MHAFAVPMSRKVTGENRGGHNKLVDRSAVSEPLPPVDAGDWAWLQDLTPASHKHWTREKIHAELSKFYFDEGVTVTRLARDIVVKLSIEHYTLMIAWGQIEAYPTEPKVGNRCAYQVAHSALAGISKSMAALGVYPLPKQSIDQVDDDPEHEFEVLD